MEEEPTTAPTSTGARVVLVNKPPGTTPLAAIERLRQARPDEFGDDVKVGYAGRLDPLARGLLVCMAGPAGGPPLALQKALEGRSKVYEFKVKAEQEQLPIPLLTCVV